MREGEDVYFVNVCFNLSRDKKENWSSIASNECITMESRHHPGTLALGTIMDKIYETNSSFHVK